MDNTPQVSTLSTLDVIISILRYIGGGEVDNADTKRHLEYVLTKSGIQTQFSLPTFEMLCRIRDILIDGAPGDQLKDMKHICTHMIALPLVRCGIVPWEKGEGDGTYTPPEWLEVLYSAMRLYTRQKKKDERPGIVLTWYDAFRDPDADAPECVTTLAADMTEGTLRPRVQRGDVGTLLQPSIAYTTCQEVSKLVIDALVHDQ